MGTYIPFEIVYSAHNEKLDILHLGAHLGEEQDFYLQLGARDICWVEAQKPLIPELEKKVGSDSVISCAVYSIDNEEMTFHRTSNSYSSSLLQLSEDSPWDSIKETSAFTVTTSTIDSIIEKFLSRGRLKRNLVIVLDLQGSELEAIKGLNRNLSKVQIICCEVTRNGKIYINGVPRWKIVASLFAKGFFPAFNKINPMTGHGETIFVRSNLILTNLDIIFSKRLLSIYLHCAYYYNLRKRWPHS
jgi:FkbM family methyltransferase